MSERIQDRPQGDAALELLRLAGPRPGPPAERTARVEEAVRAHWRLRVAARRRSRWLWLGAAAAAALVVGIGLWRAAGSSAVAPVAAVERIVGEVWRVGALGRHALVAADTLSVGDRVETRGAALAALRLEGGASLRLDGGTRLRIDDDGRLILHAGAVYLDSGDETGASPVTVETPLGQVREVGTRFQVRLEGERLEVRVREGRVRVDAAAETVEVAGGQLARVVREAAPEVEPAASTGEAWQWLMDVAPPFPIDGRTAADLVRWVARETGLEVAWEEPGLAAAAEEMVLHGELEGVRPDRAASAVLPTCGLAADLDGNVLRIGRISP